ncbi:hypothetical protein NDU88_006179 [Pleurodeles waltl]|uniref:Uncharacterized protein n=1 Tax=Pleurodeles waltl TaxID=8319 RepID=A0AAV7TZD3_PLEWA|nr:hypothetical protein NDU88_006179 [Pleurodeles waltl]
MISRSAGTPHIPTPGPSCLSAHPPAEESPPQAGHVNPPGPAKVLAQPHLHLHGARCCAHQILPLAHWGRPPYLDHRCTPGSSAILSQCSPWDCSATHSVAQVVVGSPASVRVGTVQPAPLGAEGHSSSPCCITLVAAEGMGHPLTFRYSHLMRRCPRPPDTSLALLGLCPSLRSSVRPCAGKPQAPIPCSGKMGWSAVPSMSGLPRQTPAGSAPPPLLPPRPAVRGGRGQPRPVTPVPGLRAAQQASGARTARATRIHPEDSGNGLRRPCWSPKAWAVGVSRKAPGTG